MSLTIKFRSRNKLFHNKSNQQNKIHESFYKFSTPPLSNISRRYGRGDAKKSTHTCNVEHEVLAKNYLPSSDLVKGWVTDNGAFTHMTPLMRYCKNLKVTSGTFSLQCVDCTKCKLKAFLG